jgi:hypothetical protein
MNVFVAVFLLSLSFVRLKALSCVAANIQCGSLSLHREPSSHNESVLDHWLKVGLKLNDGNQKGGSCSVNIAAAVKMWQLSVYRKVDREMGLAAAEFEDEMRRLRMLVDALRTLRCQFHAVRFD